MTFPDAPRVVYRQNPLTEVICQLRFPTILRIDSEPPSGFQERIRGDYPLYREESPTSFAGVPPEVAELLRMGLPQTSRPARKFLSSDESWTVALNRDFIALAGSKYRRWEDFKSHLEKVVTAFQDEYKPAFFSRVGLRYQNLLVRSALGLGEVGWERLLKEPVAGVFLSPDLRGAVQNARSQWVFGVQGGGNVTLRHGVGQREGNNETCYVIDSDFYADERTEPVNVVRILDHFHQQARRLFRWCISDVLHDAMGPEPIV